MTAQMHCSIRTALLRLMVIGALGTAGLTPLMITQVSAHDGVHGHSHASQATTETARGIVFDDINGNRKRDPGEPGIAKVRVSNGRQIVETNNGGQYELPVSNDAIIFVIKPRNWSTPLNAQKLPQFYYIHKPDGSPKDAKFAGVAPTGPLPESVDFPLSRAEEPAKFRALLFGDPQPRNITEAEYIAHDVVEQIVAAEGHDASFGVTLGDIVFDDLSVMQPLNQSIALIGIPWYNVIGNHDLNLDAPTDALSDETFESIYGPSYYSFDYGPTHFVVIDNVNWIGPKNGQRGRYTGGLGEAQLEFIKQDLKMIPEDQLVVLLMHIPLPNVDDRHGLYRLIEQRPATVSISAHQHYMEHRYIDATDGWKGEKPHHHIINVTVSGSWWRGQPDERGIPHATMSDGGPNGYSIMEFDGQNYSLEFRAAGRPETLQMNVYAPEAVPSAQLATTVVVANVFGASQNDKVEMRLGESPWVPMQQFTAVDPAFAAEKAREAAFADRDWTELPAAHATPHLFRGMLPPNISKGTQLIEIRATSETGKVVKGRRIIRIEE